jgi:hypothetical protein
MERPNEPAQQTARSSIAATEAMCDSTQGGVRDDEWAATNAQQSRTGRRAMSGTPSHLVRQPRTPESVEAGPQLAQARGPIGGSPSQVVRHRNPTGSPGETSAASRARGQAGHQAREGRAGLIGS